MAQRAGDITVDPRLIAGALAMGVVTSVVAAVIPAPAAASVDPVKALQKGRNQSLTEGENASRRWWALVCASASVIALVFSRFNLIFYAGFVLSVVAAVLLAPALSLWLSRALRPLLDSLGRAVRTSARSAPDHGGGAAPTALRVPAP